MSRATPVSQALEQAGGTPVESAAELPDAARQALRDLLLSLADNKRLLGIHYSDWMLGAPTLETGIAASSMAQDEWGHGRLTYALLSDFGDEPRVLEHERAADRYHSTEALDGPWGSWAGMIAAALLLDTAFTTQYAALVDSRYAPVHNRVQKMLDEEAFHFQYALGWAHRIAGAAALRGALLEAAAELLPLALRWFGPDDEPSARALRDAGLVAAGPDSLRERYLAQVAPVLEPLGLAGELGLEHQEDRGWTYARPLDWTGWDAAKRRSAPGGPSQETVERARGDRNRAVLMD